MNHDQIYVKDVIKPKRFKSFLKPFAAYFKDVSLQKY